MYISLINIIYAIKTTTNSKNVGEYYMQDRTIAAWINLGKLVRKLSSTAQVYSANSGSDE